MRPLIVLLAFSTLLFGAPAALASPTCQDRNGGTIRCGAPGAMPVGWTASPEVMLRQQAALEENETPHAFSNAVCLVGLLLALFAFLPEFDGSKDSDWNAQEGDDDKR